MNPKKKEFPEVCPGLSKVVWDTIDKYMEYYKNMLDNQDGLVLGNVPEERLNVLQSLKNSIWYNVVDESFKDAPETPLGHCRCAPFPKENHEVKKIKIMLSSPMKGKTSQEIDVERNEMVNLIFDRYGENNCEIISSVIEDHEEKSELECFSESIFCMSQCNVLAMGFGWKNARGCKLEYLIGKEYGLHIIYLDKIKQELEE